MNKLTDTEKVIILEAQKEFLLQLNTRIQRRHIKTTIWNIVGALLNVICILQEKYTHEKS
jgi:hypothetical protein